MAVKPGAEVLRVAQELSFARALASNDKTLRDRALKRLNKWFASMPKKKEHFNEASFTRLWKGLYYCVWMSDKPLIQEECVDRISKLIHALKNFEDCRKFVRCFFQCMSEAWFNLDGHRIDKYLMLVRRFLRQLFERLHENEWNIKMVEDVVDCDLKPFLISAPLGLNIHIAEIFLEELAKVGRGKLPSDVLFVFVKPFGEMLTKTKDLRYMEAIRDNVFFYLLRQSEEALKHQAKFAAWRDTGYAGGEIDVMEEVANDDELEEDEVEEDEDIMAGDESDMDDDESPLDPRAGRVDVLLPPLEFDASQIIENLNNLRSNPDLTSKARKQIGLILRKYKTYQTGKYPLGIHNVELIEPEDENEVINEAAEKLGTIEEELIQKSDVAGQKKKKPLLFAKSQDKVPRGKRKSSTWETTPLKIKKESLKSAASPATEGSWSVSPVTIEDQFDFKPFTTVDNGFVSTPLILKNHTEHNESNSIKMNSSQYEASSKFDTHKKQLPSSSESPKSKRNKKKQRNNTSTGDLDCSWGESAWESTADEIEISLSPVSSDLRQLPDSSASLLTPFVNGHSSTTGSGKKVEFVLNRNCSQEEREYKLSVKKRPSYTNVFDAFRKPPQGVLKQTPTNSPTIHLDKFSPSLVEIS